MKNKPFKTRPAGRAAESGHVYQSYTQISVDQKFDDVARHGGDARCASRLAFREAARARISKENLDELLSALKTGVLELAKMMGISKSGLDDILKRRWTLHAEQAIEVVENKLRGCTGWFYSRKYEFTDGELERFRQSCELRTAVERPGTLVRRDTLPDFNGRVSNLPVPTREEPPDFSNSRPWSTSDISVLSSQPASTGNTRDATSFAGLENGPQQLWDRDSSTAGEARPVAANDITAKPDEHSCEDPHLSTIDTVAAFRGKHLTHEDFVAQDNPAEAPYVSDDGATMPAAPKPGDVPGSMQEVAPQPLPPKRGRGRPKGSGKKTKNSAPALQERPVSEPVAVDEASDDARTVAGATPASQNEQAAVLPTPQESTTPPIEISGDQRITLVLENLSRLSAAMEWGRDRLPTMTGIVPEWIAQMREGHYPKEMAPAVRRLEQALLLMSREFEEERFTPTSVSLNGFTERLNQLLAHPEELVKPLVVKERTPPGRPSTAGDRMRGSQPTPEEAPSVKLRTDHLRAICQASQRRFGVRALTGIKAARLDAALDKNNPRPLRVEEEALIVKAFSLPEGWFQSTHKHRTLSTSDFEQRLKQGATALGLS